MEMTDVAGVSSWTSSTVSNPTGNFGGLIGYYEADRNLDFYSSGFPTTDQYLYFGQYTVLVQAGLYGQSIAAGSVTLTFTVTIQNTCATTLSLNGGVNLINKDDYSSYNVGADNTVDVSLVTLPLSLVIDEL